MRIIFSILFIVSYLLANTQNNYSTNITSREGLPNNAIRSIFEDSRGYLWIGTDAGVSRWDGETFNTYNTLDGLAGNKVWWIDEDDNGNLWFACFGGGITKFDGKKFVSFTDKDGLCDNYVRVIKHSSVFNCLLIGTNNSISVLKDSVFYNFSKQNGKLPSSVIITSILADSNRVIFVDYTSNHYKLSFNNENTPILLRIENSFLNKYAASSCFINSSEDTIISWDKEGIAIYDSDLVKEFNKIGQVFGITQDCIGNIWAASWNGGSAISPPRGLFLIKNDNVKRMNSSYNINSVLGWSVYFENKQNLVFYGTLDKGLYKIPPRLFEFYTPEYFGEHELSITDVETDSENNIWFITDSLLVVLNDNSYKKSKLVNFYRTRIKYELNTKPFDEAKSRIRIVDEEYYHRNCHFFNMEFDNKDKLWVTIMPLGFFSTTNKNTSLIKYHASDVHKTFVFDNNDTLFLCNDWSLGIRKYLDFKKSDEFIFYQDSLHLVYSKKIIAFQNEIWVCSRISDVFMLKKGKLRIITVEDSTINKIVNDICFDEKGFAYLGGSDGRIEVLEAMSRKKVFEINHKEYNNSVHWLKISNGKLFAGYSDGLRVYKISDIVNHRSNFRFYGLSEGYSINKVTSSVVDKNGDIWLGTNNGLLKIATEFFEGCDNQPLTTVIQNVEIFNQEVDWEQYSAADSWSGLPLETPVLEPDNNHVSIYFHTINYNNPQNDLYYYKLNGIDRQWVGPSNKKYVVYPYLKSGKYKFMVKSKNKLSELFSHTAEFSFIISTPWYKQLWFYVFLIVLVIVALFASYKFRLEAIKKKEEGKRHIQQKISELETKALQAQMNPHFLFNSINSIQSYILDNDVDEALTYLSSFSKVIRMTLEFVNTKFVSLKDVLDYLNHYVKLENMRFDDLFDYVVVIDDRIDPETVLIPPMLLQTIIENSIKHGMRHLNHKGTIKLEIVKNDNESFKCIIEDNGIGRLKSAQINNDQNIKKESLGLKITKERLEILNANKGGIYKIEIIDLYSENGMSAGTRVEITLAFILS